MRTQRGFGKCVRRVLTAACLPVLVIATMAQAAGPYQIDWYTIDGGGGTSNGGPYTLTGTIGQPDADWCVGGLYELLGGFWPGAPIIVEECLPSTYSTYDDWVALGKPDCWCWPYQCDGDADGATQGLFKTRVGTNDLSLIIANWLKTADDPDLDPCADLDHKAQGLLQYRVGTNDLSILVGNWQKTDAELPGNCPRPE